MFVSLDERGLRKKESEGVESGPRREEIERWRRGKDVVMRRVCQEETHCRQSLDGSVTRGAPASSNNKLDWDI